MRILGLDYGSKTVGVAVSDATCLIAQPLETIERKQENKLRQTYARIEALIEEHEAGKIVVGLPKMMNNTEGSRVEATREFAADLERRTGLPVIFVDERLTTVEANRILEATGVCVSGRKEHIDKMAAAIILQSYLDREAHNNMGGNENEEELNTEIPKITFETEDGDQELYVLDQTKLFGKNYILLTDDVDDEDGSFFVLREEPGEEEDMVTYTEIEDENELKAVIKVFDELLEDFDLEV